MIAAAALAEILQFGIFAQVRVDYIFLARLSLT